MEDKLAQEHVARVFNNFRELRDRQLLCDFTICVGTKKLKAHRVVLATSSDYFKAMFSHDSKESSTGEVNLQNIDADAVEAIIDYIYTGNISLSEHTIEDIILAASILQVQVIQNICINFIKSKIDSSNCLGVASLAERCNLLDLNCKALDYCYDHFREIVNEREFSQLDDSLLTRLLSNDKLNVDDETEVFRAVIMWVKADKQQRMPKLNQVIKHVRFATLDPATLIALSSDDHDLDYEDMIIRTSPECQNLINKAKDYLLLKDFPEIQEKRAGDLVIRPRHSRRRIYVVGGVGSSGRYQSMAMAEVYDSKTNVWTDIKPMSESRCSVGVAALKHSIYAIGGHDGSAHLRSVERFDIVQNTWMQDVAPMRFKRSSVAVVTLDDSIYAIGGQANGGLALDKVERYSVATNSWKECAAMLSPRLGAGVAVLNGRIYVMGGSDHEEVFKTVEIYDPKTNIWTWGPTMLGPRKHFGCCSYSGVIYAVGGRNRHDGELNSSEILKPGPDNGSTGEWSEIPKMRKRRAGLGLVELDGLIYAIGGQNHDEKLDLVEVYDPQTRTWRKGTSMRHCRLGAGLTVHPS